MRLDAYYAHMMELVAGIGAVDDWGYPVEPNEKQAERRKKLFGHKVVYDAPPDYYVVMDMMASDFDPETWFEMDIEHRAQYRAAQRIRTMIETLRRNMDLNEQAAKNAGLENA